jgi:hypothetical protein
VLAAVGCTMPCSAAPYLRQTFGSRLDGTGMGVGHVESRDQDDTTGASGYTSQPTSTQSSLFVLTPTRHDARGDRQNCPTGGGYYQLGYDRAIVNAPHGRDQGLED